MAKQRHLNNAPIVEAIVDFRTKLPNTFKVQEFSLLKETLINDYPVMDESLAYETGVKMTSGKLEQSLTDKGLHGYFFKSQDGKKVVQFRLDGFTFSRLKPYTNCQEVLGEAKRLWKFYVDKASPELITRIAVRYINQLIIPLPIADFAHYLTAPPTIPQTLPQGVCNFLTRVTLHDEKLDIMAHIIQALENIVKKDNAAIILDIDVFKLKESGFEEPEMWRTLEQLRDLKNRI